MRSLSLICSLTAFLQLSLHMYMRHSSNKVRHFVRSRDDPFTMLLIVDHVIVHH